jgi:hypothetical protein
MKASVGKFICIAVVSVALLSCDWFFKDVMPYNSKAVVSYQIVGNKSEHEHLRPENWKNGFILGKDTLKSWFPHIFNDEQKESKCNYFAIYFNTSTSLIEYWILSQSVVLYKIEPSNARCDVTTDIVYHAMLVCDDTKEGNLKDKINLNSIHSYTDENWDCKKGGKNVFF